MKTVKMRKNRLFCVLALICFTMFSSCNTDEEQNQTTSVISDGLMLMSPVYTLGDTDIGGGAGVSHSGKLWYLDVLEFSNDNTAYRYKAYRAGTKDGIVISIHGHEDWVRSSIDSYSIWNYAIDEGNNILSLNFKDSNGVTHTDTYTMNCVNGKLYSLINDRGYEAFFKWEDGETYWSQKYDEEHKDNH